MSIWVRANLYLPPIMTMYKEVYIINIRYLGFVKDGNAIRRPRWTCLP